MHRKNLNLGAFPGPRCALALAATLLCACSMDLRETHDAPGKAESRVPYPGTDWTDAVSHPQAVEAEPPTLHSLGIRWPVLGDANANAGIRVEYRAQAATGWQQAMPLHRVSPEHQSEELRVAGGWLFAGSIVDLDPGTAYVIRLTLADPDGGDTHSVLTLRTRSEPVTPPGMRVRHVIPAADGVQGSGSAGDPFHGLASAQQAAQPGDLFLLHAGVYGVGRWTIDHQGTAGRPIIYRAAGDGEVILDGLGESRLVSANDVHHVWFEDLTLRNATYLFVGHKGADMVIRRCRFEVDKVGLEAINGGYDESRGFFILDNVFHGPSRWPRSHGIEANHAISVTGSGHVIAYNRISNFGDAIHGNEHGRLSASDIHNNDISDCTDDGIETDYSDTNVRVFRNRITNAFAGITAQPVLGGPMYAFRNAILNVQYSPFKLHNDTSGVLLLHNTSVSSGIAFNIQPGGDPVNDVISRNNLFIGNHDYGLRATSTMQRCDFDNDGYGGFQGRLGGAPFAIWEGRTYGDVEAAKESGRLYAYFGAVPVDPDHAFSGTQPLPDDYTHRYAAAENQPLLAAGSAAVDAGLPLANFNDTFSGAAPDLGCCELGSAPPHYGPRTPGIE